MPNWPDGTKPRGCELMRLLEAQQKFLALGAGEAAVELGWYFRGAIRSAIFSVFPIAPGNSLKSRAKVLLFVNLIHLW